MDQKLSTNINALYQTLLLTKENYDKRNRFVLKIDEILKNEWPNYDIQSYIFGSSNTELAMPKSDIDICITTKKNDGKFLCDININNKDALENTCLIKAYLEIDPRVRILVIIIRHWAKQRELGDATNGTLSLYTWTCMILNFLQRCDPPTLPVFQIPQSGRPICIDKLLLREFKNNESISELLLRFFEHFAYEFDYTNNVVSLRKGKYLTKQEKIEIIIITFVLKSLFKWKEILATTLAKKSETLTWEDKSSVHQEFYNGIKKKIENSCKIPNWGKLVKKDLETVLEKYKVNVITLIMRFLSAMIEHNVIIFQYVIYELLLRALGFIYNAKEDT
ncbi:10709_t:CDS:2, partial [Gigaspora margarita]